MKNFKTIDGDIGNTVSQRVFTGRLTKERFNKIDSYLRRNTIHYGENRCSHEWDCCGCLVYSRFEIAYKANQVIIINTQAFNY
jgi:hypothetical protein